MIELWTLRDIELDILDIGFLYLY